MNYHLTGMTGWWTGAGARYATLSTTMAVNQEKVTQFQFILMYGRRWTPFQHSGTEQGQLGGAGLAKQCRDDVKHYCYMLSSCCRM